MAITVKYGQGALLRAIAADQNLRRERYDQQNDRADVDALFRRIAQRDRNNLAQQEMAMRAAEGRMNREARLEELEMRLNAAADAQKAADPYSNYSKRHVLSDGTVLSGPQARTSERYRKEQAAKMRLLENAENLSGAEKKIASQMLNQRQMLEAEEEDTRPPAMRQAELKSEYEASTFRDDDGNVWGLDPKSGGFKVLYEAKPESSSRSVGLSASSTRNYRRDAETSIMERRGGVFFDGAWEDADGNPMSPPTSEEIIAEAREIRRIDEAINASDEQMIAMPEEQFKEVEQNRKFLELAEQLGVDPAQARNILPGQVQQIAASTAPSGPAPPSDQFLAGDAPAGDSPASGDLMGELPAQPTPASVPATVPYTGQRQVVGPDGHLYNGFTYTQTLADSIGGPDLYSVGVAADGEEIKVAPYNQPNSEFTKLANSMTKDKDESEYFKNKHIYARFVAERKKLNADDGPLATDGDEAIEHYNKALLEKYLREDKTVSEVMEAVAQNDQFRAYQFIQEHATPFLQKGYKTSEEFKAEIRDIFKPGDGSKDNFAKALRFMYDAIDSTMKSLNRHPDWRDDGYIPGQQRNAGRL